MTLKNASKLPKEVIPALEKHTTILSDLLGVKLVGVYVHGSAAMGGFRTAQSDLDYLAVVSDRLSVDERERLATSFLGIFGEDAPQKGIEMSIVLERFAGQDFRYPTPYEFHFGTRQQIRFHGLPHKIEEVDPDLAAHFTIIKRRGLCIFGKSIERVFADVPGEYYLASIALDSEESFANIQQKTGSGMCSVPMYAVLNFCRVLAFIDHGHITSKIEGAEWALYNLPDRYYPVIIAALEGYRSNDSPSSVDSRLLKDFASYANARISTVMTNVRPTVPARDV
jgi:predicted nucleotidyltransferase